MKSVFVAGLVLISACLAQAGTRITGPQAAELYKSLNIVETPVADEHSGPVYGYAKYGKTFGCQRDLTSTEFECWLN